MDRTDFYRKEIPRVVGCALAFVLVFLVTPILGFLFLMVPVRVVGLGMFIIMPMIILTLTAIIAGVYLFGSYHLNKGKIKNDEKRKNDDKSKNDDAYFTIGDDGELVELDDDDEHDETGTSHGQRLS